MAIIWSFIDERKILDRLLKNKRNINVNTYQSIVVYIKYLKEMGKSKIEIRNELDNIMEEYYDGFISSDWFDVLNSLVNKYTKPKYRDFTQPDDIRITKKELEFIKSYQDIIIEKLMFVMLVIAKASSKDKSNLWLNCDSQDVFKLAKFKYKRSEDRLKQRGVAIYDMAQKGLLETSRICDSVAIKLLYGDSSINDDDMILHIDEENMEHMVMYYLQWRDGLPNCSICGIPFIKKSNRAINCTVCAKKKERERAKAGMRKSRASSDANHNKCES